ncbi:amidase family protein [Pseudomonas sp. Bout1]|uniref:amidase family protein n=1 Tax=Pseudomonas sp. Bout1 TaxID=3048600 RepID=UPI002AB59272|nr:amidase family protein [Pseudomonas sp. Bout1]MDY7534963.1 amidase family protein [Pseudomonas sp. Bout1]MEB0187667.1 amidase family protein [Pseudomonas sp. Bout1]
MNRPNGANSGSVVRDSLKLIANMDKGLQGANAFIEINPDAREKARELDQERAEGKVRGPLHGVPIALKDVFETGDKMQTSGGSMALVGRPASKNAKVVDNLLKAGVVIIGKTNMSELSNFRSDTPLDGWSSRGGQTLNPHRLSGQAAGSSTGSAVAVAQGIVPLALGVETNGSIITPAAYNGVVGFKPTEGLVSTEGVMTSSRQDTVGTFTRNVRDAAQALNAMTQTNLYTVGLGPDSLVGKRIGYTPLPELSADDASDPAKRADRQHFEDAIQLLQAKGATMVPVGRLAEGLSDDTYDSYGLALYADVQQKLEDYLAGREGLAVKSLSELIDFNERNNGPGVPDQRLLTMIRDLDVSEHVREELWADIGPIFKGTINTPLTEHKLDAIVSNFLSHSYYYGAAAGYPGISVPSGMDDDGMPTAVHFYGASLSEPTLLSVAYGYEQASQAIRKPAFMAGLR